MGLPRRSTSTDALSATELNGKPLSSAPRRAPLAIDWAGWLRALERQRRMISRQDAMVPRHNMSNPIVWLDRATFVSFRLDGIEISEAEVTSARTPEPMKRALRSRLAQRARNHVAILLGIEKSLRRAAPLSTSAVLRWYTSMGSGLSNAMLSEPTMARLEQVVRRINSPHLRLKPAIGEVVRLHLESLRDELVPSFNGILARLMLRYHLGRCGLPAILPEPERDLFKEMPEMAATERMLELINQSYERLLA
jgi:hypothetical protein